MRPRSGPLRAAAALAAAFVAIRIVYRVLFHGADGDGAVLLPLPVFRMPVPLGHVQLLGPVTADGLWAAVLSAVPIALTILAFGVLNALLDMPRLLARGARSGPFRGLARALAVAWATLPGLADAVRSARFAQRLRGERGGVRLLAPVLERTLERATAVAAALELRGYAGRGLSGACEHPVLVRDATLGFGSVTTLRVDELTLPTGRLTVLSGPTGSGKSTLLRALSGLHAHVDGGWATGRIEVVGLARGATPPRDTSRTVGVVLQNPRAAFATETVRDELGLALELRGVARVIIDARVREVAERIGIVALLERPLRGLSAGEATLVAIGAAIIEQPILLLVDEPLADLDAAARARIVALLSALAHEAGLSVLVAEHRATEFAGVADGWLRVDEGALTCMTPAETSEISEDVLSDAPARENGRSCSGGPVEPALSVTGVTVRHGERIAVRDAAVVLHAGEIVAVTGPNGAGKSSLLVALADETGTALVPDASDDLFLRDTVAAECRRADRRLTAASTADRFARLLSLEPEGTEFRRRLAQHPRDLSAGERRCLAIAVQTARSPAVLMIDEPTRGLDPRARALVARAIAAQADAGTAVLLATHDAGFVAALADRELPIRDGALGTDVPLVEHRDNAAPPPLVEHRDNATPPPLVEHRDNATPPPLVECRGEAAVYRDHSDQTDSRGFDTPPEAATQPPRATQPAAAQPPEETPRRRWRPAALIAANLAAISAFLWPLVASAVPTQAQAAVPYIALALAPLAVVLVLAALDASVRSAHTLALLAVLAAIGAAIRIASTGVGGVEALFVLLILAGRAFGPRFGLLLGAAAIALSAVMWGGVGPWLPFQMFACGWVGAGAGLLPRRVAGWAEIGMLSVYGILSSYLFGMIMNMWFWPFAVGASTSISYVPGGSVGENLTNFLVYSLLTSTLTWDTLRAVTTVVGLVVVGRAILGSLRRAKPVASVPAPARLLAKVDA